jgi:choloylglycine hydrolase
LPGFPDIPPLHLSIHDAKGKSLVVEFLEGKMHLFDNPVGVLTNAPEFPWHLTNLRNYISLSAMNKGAVTIDGTTLEPTGQGNGLLGIPGDWTPPSRFVKTAFVKQALKTPKDSRAATLAAIHLLNAVDIPYGTIRAEQGGHSDYTQWIVVKDLKNKKLHYRTYGDQNIHEVALTNTAQVKELTSINP